MQFYRLRAPDGKYALGGYPLGRTSRLGKVWAGKGPFLNHLALMTDPLSHYNEFELIVIDEKDESFTTTPFNIWYTEYMQEKAKKARK